MRYRIREGAKGTWHAYDTRWGMPVRLRDYDKELAQLIVDYLNAEATKQEQSETQESSKKVPTQ